MGVIIDKRLTFKKHTDNALRRIRKFLTVEKVKILVNAFTDRRFSYVLLMWMFCGKTFCSEIEKNHHRTLEVIYSIDGSYNNFLLLCLNSPSVFRFIFKSISQINPEFMWSFFKHKKLYCNLRKGAIINLPQYHGTTVQMLFTFSFMEQSSC